MNPAMRDLFLGGEDEEVQDFTPPELRHPEQAYLLVDVRSEQDGSATVWFETNDRNDNGVPDRDSSSWDEIIVSWSERHESVGQARQAVGRSRIDPSGRAVIVLNDGEPTG